MLRCLRRLLAVGLCTLLLVGGFQVAADASGVPRVSNLSVAGQDWCTAKMRLKWKAVSGATYQVRWGSSKARMRAAKPVPVRSNRIAAGPLSMGGTSYFQVRAVRGGRVGSWSAVRAGHFTSHWPALPRLSGHGVPGAAQFTWGCTQYASRYRVRWAAAPYGKWPATTNYVSGWLPGTARSSTYRVVARPQPGDHMLGVAYANPVWGRLEAGNPNGGVRLSTGWTPVFPAPPSPGTGDPLRVGTYNVMLSPTGTRADAIAANIKGHGLTVVALQEANATSVDAVLLALGSGWAAAPIGDIASQQILYRTSSFRLATDPGIPASGTFAVPNHRTGGTLVTPWVRLAAVASSNPLKSRPVYVVSAHFQENATSTALQKKHDSGNDAAAVMGGIDAVNENGDPVIVAGDLRYLREPFGDAPGYVEAQPTFVRSGYYDAMAAVRKTNYQYTTFNATNGSPTARQTVAQSGVAPRSDYILLKGFRSCNAYVNVANWSANGLVPSDHNLVYADVTVPFAQ
jgi:hypothetical protein